MSRRLILGGAAITASAALMFPFTQASAQAAVPAQAPASTATAAAPATAAKKLFRAWLRGDRAAAARVATPSAVKKVFSYVYRAPDEFAGCTGDVCRFVHTSVNVPGGLDGILMVVSGSKVTKVYQSRPFTTPSAAARHLFASWKRHDRYSGLEAARKGAVDRLFRVKYDPKGVAYTFQGCSKEPKGYACAYSYEGGAMFMHVRGSKTTGYDVRSISYIAD
ncbi:hypothetical protein ACFFMN_31570 [Planobispora siamensis]|uniref:Tat pathway signal protein n=1 Tax=Planobispora siamensis TaxID=936338 RepID=A0A8J3SI16_9ACTN|nr:hypothetical protein [Planobispora siamensis]GIH92830.1 hypothetical protein Psi01_34600 [Planobispora siamensis]